MALTRLAILPCVRRGENVDGASTILEVKDLIVEYLGETSNVRAVDRVSLRLARGEFLGVVGESGCGKSTLCFGIAQLLTPPACIMGGSVHFAGKDLVQLHEGQLRHLRWKDFSVVMQSAMNALNPVMTVGAQLTDAMRAHERLPKQKARARAAEVLHLVGIDPLHLRSYPHQLSGGMRQRAMIAMALVFTPSLIVMDEPTSALDVVGQRALMKQILELQRQLHFAVIFVTHDMSLVSNFADRVAIMYAGQVVELGSTRALFREPKHPYSVGLLQAFPSIHGPKQHLMGIPGSPPDLRYPPPGCRFNPRCPLVHERCLVMEPPAYALPDRDMVRCHLFAGQEAEAV
jgi:peptide/nickel transport system ATP-binding protein